MKQSLAPFCLKPRSLIFQQKGVMALATVLIFSVLALFANVIHQTLLQKKYALTSSKEVELKVDLDHLISYVFGGIQRRWCFTQKLRYKRCGKGFLVHPRSSERLLINEISLGKIVQAKDQTLDPSITVPDNLIESVPLLKFPPYKLSLSDLTDPNFMLKDLFSKKYSTGSLVITGVDIYVNRIKDGDELEHEKYIEVKVEASYTLHGQTKTLNLHRVMVFYPRKLNNMSLILSGDLVLYNGSGTSVSETGKATCQPQGQDASKITTSTGVGLNFKSPVLIGGDIYVSPSATTPQANVNFFDKVFLAGGTIKKGSSPFTPSFPGSEFKDLKSFQGFKKGVFFEKIDKGLEVLSGRVDCEDTAEEMNKCLRQEDLASVDSPTIIDTTYPLVGGTDIYIDYRSSGVSSGVKYICTRLGKQRGFYDGKVMCWGKMGNSTFPYAVEVRGFEQGVEKISSDIGDSYEFYALKKGRYYEMDTGDSFKAKGFPKWGSGIKKAVHLDGGKKYFIQNGALKLYKDSSDAITTVPKSSSNANSDVFSSNVIDVSANRDMVCIIHNGEAKCKGPTNGALSGSGASDDINTFLKVSGLSQNPKQIFVHGFSRMVCGVSQYDEIYCNENNPESLEIKKISKTLAMNYFETYWHKWSTDPLVPRIKIGGDDTSEMLWSQTYNDNIPISGSLIIGNAGDQILFKKKYQKTSEQGRFSGHEKIPYTLHSRKGYNMTFSLGRFHYATGYNSSTLYGRVPTKLSYGNGSGLILGILRGHHYNVTHAVTAGGTSLDIDTINIQCGITDYDLSKCLCPGTYPNTKCRQGVHYLSGSGYEENTSPVKFKKIGTNFGSADYVRVQGQVKTSVVSQGKNHTCSVNKGEVLCWGDNSKDQLGRGSGYTPSDSEELKVPTPVLNLSNVVGIASGLHHTCALEKTPTEGKVHCWGKNDKGQTGDDPYTDASLPIKDEKGHVIKKALNIYANGNFSCAVLDKNLGEVKCWGNSKKGQLGNGKTKTGATKTAQSVLRDVDYGVDYIPKFAGDLSYRTTKLVAVKQLALGLHHACALVGESVLCWGDNEKGQLGRGDYDNEGVKIKEKYSTASHVVRRNHSLSSPLDEETRPGMFYRNLLNVTQIVSGSDHTCALLGRKGHVFCWGDNSQSQLGLGGGVTITKSHYPRRAFISNVVSLQAGAYHTCATKSDNKTYCWGDNTYKQLGVDSPLKLTSATANKHVQGLGGDVLNEFYSGFSVNCFSSSEGLKCWGGNKHGKLGNGETQDSFEPVSVKACSEEGSGHISLAADWGQDFSKYAVHSWNFACGGASCSPPEPDKPDKSALIDKLKFDSGFSSTLHPENLSFLVVSTAKNCVIGPQANFVAGFYTCQKLTIKARSDPLYIIGTIITNHLKIDPSAFQKGITWTNIYDQESVALLKKYKILRKGTDDQGRAIACSPYNQFHPSVTSDDQKNCSSVRLNDMTDPFQWTTVDPDCATLPEARSPACKRHYKRFLATPFYSSENREESLKVGGG